MIKTKRGATEIHGSKGEIYADFATITYAMLLSFDEKGWSREKSEKFLKEAFNDGLLDDEVVEKCNVKEADFDKLGKVLDELSELLGLNDDDKEDD